MSSHELRLLKPCFIFGEGSLLTIVGNTSFNCPFLWELCLNEESELETLVLNTT